jgi:hypothetical protein
LTIIGQGARIGKIQDMGDLGITLIGKNTHIPAGFTVGRNVIIGTDLSSDDFMDFADKVIPNGKKIPVDKKR